MTVLTSIPAICRNYANSAASPVHHNKISYNLKFSEFNTLILQKREEDSRKSFPKNTQTLLILQRKKGENWYTNMITTFSTTAKHTINALCSINQHTTKKGQTLTISTLNILLEKSLIKVIKFTQTINNLQNKTENKIHDLITSTRNIFQSHLSKLKMHTSH